MLAIAGLALAVALFLGERAVAQVFADWPALRDVATLAALTAIGRCRLFRHRVRAVRKAVVVGAQALVRRI